MRKAIQNKDIERNFIDKNKLVCFNYETLKYCVLDENFTTNILGIFKTNSLNKFNQKRQLKYLQQNGFFSNVKYGEPLSNTYDYLSLTVLATSKCNLNGKHCLLGKYEEQTFIDIEDFTNFISKFKVMEVTFSGGEFFQHPKYQLFLNEVKKRNIMYSVFTNGVDIPKSFLSYMDDEHLYDVQISIESNIMEVNDNIRGKNSFTKVLNTLKLLQSYKNKISLAITVAKYNIEHLDNIIEYFFNNYGIYKYKFSNLIIDGNAKSNSLVAVSSTRFNAKIQNLKLVFPEIDINKDELNDYSKGEYDFESRIYKDNFSCNAFDQHLTFTSQGMIVPCPFFFKEKINEGITIKEALCYNKKEIQNHYTAFNKAKDLINNTECKKCELANVCNVNCPYDIIKKNLNFNDYCFKKNPYYIKQKKIEKIYYEMAHILTKNINIKRNIPSIRFIEGGSENFTNDFQRNIINVDVEIVNFDREKINKILEHEFKHYLQSYKYNIPNLLNYIKKILPKELRFNANIILNITLDIIAEDNFQLSINDSIKKNMNKTTLIQLSKSKFIYFIILQLMDNHKYVDSLSKTKKPKKIIDGLVQDFLNKSGKGAAYER